MDEKISLESISLYGDAYAEKVLKDFFAHKEKISGAEILTLCSIQQINLFVVRELFKTWKEETRKLKSAYFDYEHADVKEALENYMRILSQNIAIDQANFNDLLKKAVSQTLMVVFDPYDFFSMIIAGKNNKLEVVPFREEIKYLKINKAPLERLLIRLDEKGIKEIPGNEAFAFLDQILEEVNFTPEDVEGYIEKFSSVVPLDPHQFYISKDSRATPTPIAPLRKEEVKVTLSPPPVQHKPRANVVRQPPQNNPSINDKLSDAPRNAVVENFHKIAKIKNNLTINQKFMFTKVLFHGDFELFSKAIDDLDRQDNIKGAMRYLEENYEDWDQESEEFHEFMELIAKRFM